MIGPVFKYRPATADDRQFVISGWSSSLRETRDLPFISMADYPTIMHSQIERVLARPATKTLVVEGSVLAGFICYEKDARIVEDRGIIVADYVFYLYIAQPFRRCGLARLLISATGIGELSRFHYACRTRSSWELRSKTPNAKYSPFHARYSPEETKDYERSIPARRARRR